MNGSDLQAHPAPLAKRANVQTIPVRLHGGALVAHVDADRADTFVEAGAALWVRQMSQRRYIRLGQGITITRTPEFPTPAETVKINQTGCMFEPHVVAVLVNQRIEIANADPSNHNIHVMAEANPAWNVTQTPQAPPKVAQFAKPEIGLVLMCNIHPWMRVYANVLSNPYYAITGPDGSFTIQGLPPGSYILEAWHERFGAQEKKVKAGVKADFTFTE